MIDLEHALALSRDGNKRAAEARVQRAGRDGELGRSEMRDLLARIHGERTRVRSFLAPTVIPGEEGSDLVVALEVSYGDTWGPSISGEPRAAVERAFDLAWATAGAPGPRPATALRVPLLEREARGLRGESLHLGSLLAALGLYCAVEPLKNVLATGAFESPLAEPARKLALLEASGPALGVSELLVAGDPPAGVSDSRLVRSPTPAEAARRAFGHVPWHADAESTRIHVHTSPPDRPKREPPRRWAQRSVRIHDLPFPLDPPDYPRALADILGLIEAGGHPRVELSLAGPVVFAAYLGAELKSHPAEIRIIHEERPWWTNKTQAVERLEARDESDSAPSLVVTRREDVLVPPGWTAWAIGIPKLEPRDLPGVIARLLPACGGKARLAIDGPQPLGFAIGQSLRNRVDADYHLFGGGKNDPAFRVDRSVRFLSAPPVGFLNISGDPVATWTEVQRTAARALGHGEPVDPRRGLPDLAPEADEGVVERLADDIFDAAVTQGLGGACVACDSALAFALVRRFAQRGVRCYVPTTRSEGAGPPYFVRWRELRA